MFTQGSSNAEHIGQDIRAFLVVEQNTKRQNTNLNFRSILCLVCCGGKSSWSQNRVKHQNTKKKVKQEFWVRISHANLQTSKSQSHITLLGRPIPIGHRSPFFFFSCHRSASHLQVRSFDADFDAFLIEIHSER
jgi:hypothetical protein